MPTPAAPEPRAALSATPAIEPTGAADVLAHPLEARRDALVLRLLAAGFVEVESTDASVRRFDHRWSICTVPTAAYPAEHVDRAFQSVEEALGRFEAVNARQGDVVELVRASDHPTTEGLLSALFGPPAPRPALTDVLAAAMAPEPTDHAPVAGVSFASALDALKVPAEAVDEWRRMNAEPIAPGPTLAEVQAERAEAKAEIDRLTAALDCERARANEAIAQLTAAKVDNAKLICDTALSGLRIVAESAPLARVAELERVQRLADSRISEMRRREEAITALLDADPERSPAWDDNDQPIPLARRVEIALMPEGIGQSRTERRVKALEAELAALRDHVPDAQSLPVWRLENGLWLLKIAGIWLAEYRPGDCLLISGSGRYPVDRHDPQDMLRRRGLPLLPSEAVNHSPDAGKMVNG